MTPHEHRLMCAFFLKYLKIKARDEHRRALLFA